MPEKRFAVVVNPQGGIRQGGGVLQQVRPWFDQAGAQLTVRFTSRGGDATRFARALDLDDYDGLCVIGGDGTVHEVVNGLLTRDDQRRIPLGLIPAGTGNTLHHQLHCSDPADAARAIVAGVTRPLDVARVRMSGHTVYCVNIVGWGAVADINRIAERFRLFGPMRYSVASLWKIVLPKRRRARLRLDDEWLEGEFLFVIGCNTRSTGTGMVLAPNAEIDDGKIDLVALRPASRRRLLRALRNVLRGDTLDLPEAVIRQVSEFAIDTASGDPLNLDGEVKGTAPLTVEMMPRALQIFCPSGSAKLR